jgi:lysozyme
MTPSKNCLSLIESFEGCKLKAYKDLRGIWTIGYGHTNGVYPGQVITQQVAEALLQHDIQYASSVVNTHAIPCTQGQFDALVDFVFNLGAGNFLSSTLLKMHLAKNYQGAADQLLRWDHSGGEEIPGLLRRREAERKLYLGE